MSKTLAPAALKYMLQIMCYYTKHVNCHYQNIVCKHGVVHKERLQTLLLLSVLKTMRLNGSSFKVRRIVMFSKLISNFQ